MAPSSPSDTRSPEDLDSLRETWKTLYTHTLPDLARRRDAAQKKWPVTLDHCFARIILDNTVGAKPELESDPETTSGTKSDTDTGADLILPWDTVISRPAVRNMNAAQLRAAIALGERIRSGKVDLVDLDKRSLEGRGKEYGKYGGQKKRKGDAIDADDVDREKGGERKRAKRQSALAFARGGEGVTAAGGSGEWAEAHGRGQLERAQDVKSTISRDSAIKTLRRIRDDKSLTPFRRRLYTSLLSVPEGQFTTYAALAKHLDSVARAVGNGMQNNPFAPDVPCHRVVASDGHIGGFKGEWERDGKGRGNGKALGSRQQEKMRLLKREGVRFDGNGKVKGLAWSGFWDWRDWENEFGKVD